MSLDDMRLASSYEECIRHYTILDDVCTALENLKDESGKPLESATSYRHQFDQLYSMLTSRVGKNKPAHE